MWRVAEYEWAIKDRLLRYRLCNMAKESRHSDATGMRHLTVVAAAVAVVVPWVAAVWLLLCDEGWWRIVAWLFMAGKGLMLLSTAVAWMVHPALAKEVFAGRYRFDSHGLHGLTQALSRFVWELPQLGLGYLFAQWRNILGKVERVDTLDGVTFVTGRHWQPHFYAGISLGCFANMWVSGAIGDDFESYARRSPFHIFGHEYGHTVDSQLWGLLYLPVIGLPSLISQAFGLSSKARHRHDDFWAERRADCFGKRFFND